MEAVLGKAKALEKAYEWAKAAEHYGQAIRAVRKEDLLKNGEAQERIGFCFNRAAMQAKSQEEFKQRMQRAIEAYEKAHRIYEKLTDEQKTGRMFRCGAIAKYLGYWLAPDPSEKKKLLDECLELEGKALAGFLESGDMQEYRRTYSELSLVFFCRVFLEWDRQTLKSILEKGRKWGEKAIADLSELGDSYENAGAYLTLATCLSDAGFYLIAESEEIDTYRLEAVKYLAKAVELSDKNGDVFLLGLSHLWLGINSGEEEAASHHEKALECGKQTRDNFIIANGLDYLAYNTYWKALATEDPEERRQLAEKAMLFYTEAHNHYCIISFISPRGGFIGPPSGQAEHYYQLTLWETDPRKRLEFLEKSEKLGMEALKIAEDSSMPLVIAQVLHVVSKTFQARARVERAPPEKKSRLERALKYRERTIEIFGQLTPFFYWNLGVMQNYLAGIRAELADIEPNVDNRRRLLEEAVVSKEECLKLCNKVMPYFERKGETSLFAALQIYQDTYATLLTRLYDLTGKSEYLRKAIEVLREAIESASKLDMVSLIAESYWKIAKSQDIMGEHLRAARNFKHASDSYIKAADKVPQLKAFYQNHASYMGAWSEIAKARHYHAENQYGQAKEHYEMAAQLHKSTKRWNHLTPNYLAWARLEEAEELSRKEQVEEAKALFKEAAKLFREAKTSIRTLLDEAENKYEKEMLANLARVSDVRREYCLGRIALEEAKIFDKQGHYVASSKKYGTATKVFQKTARTESGKRREGLQPIIYLCQAWQKMMMAEAKASPTMYDEAAELFEKAREYTVDQPTSLLALANSSFCKALAAGTEFEITKDTAFYLTATQHLDSAANYYLKAGFKTASEYAEATQRLLDAYLYMHKAKTEADPDKKARFYIMAERVLQASSGSFLKARYPGKQEQVARLLQKVRKERELALSLSEVLHAPLETSTTATFTTPTSTEETPIGLERFEHAQIQATLILRAKDVEIGEDIDLEIELVNTGKAAASLIKVEELVPQNFKVKRAPETYRVEDSYLNMKGRRLAPLKTEEVKLVLKPATKGTFILKPRILYIDEVGKYKSHEPEPVTVTVKELGIRGWIRGAR